MAEKEIKRVMDLSELVRGDKVLVVFKGREITSYEMTYDGPDKSKRHIFMQPYKNIESEPPIRIYGDIEDEIGFTGDGKVVIRMIQFGICGKNDDDYESKRRLIRGETEDDNVVPLAERGTEV